MNTHPVFDEILKSWVAPPKRPAIKTFLVTVTQQGRTRVIHTRAHHVTDAVMNVTESLPDHPVTIVAKAKE